MRLREDRSWTRTTPTSAPAFALFCSNYMTEHRPQRIRSSTSAFARPSAVPETVGFSFKTFQRFLAGNRRVGDEAVGGLRPLRRRYCPARLETHRMPGEALHAIYNRPLSRGYRGVYAITSWSISDHLVIRPLSAGVLRCHGAFNRPSSLRRLYDGALVSTGTGIHGASERPPHAHCPRAYDCTS